MEVEERSVKASSPRATPIRRTRVPRGTPLEPIAHVNDAFALQGTLRTWCGLFSATGRVDISFHSFVDRIMRFMCQKEVPWDEMLGSLSQTTRPLCTPKFNAKRETYDDLTSKEERDAMERRRVAAREARCREVPAAVPARMPAASPIHFDNQPPNEDMPNVVQPIAHRTAQSVLRTAQPAPQIVENVNMLNIEPSAKRGRLTKGGRQTRKRRA